MTLEEFLQSPHKNHYIRFKTIEAYVRKGNRLINNTLYNTLDLANIKNTNRPDNIKYNHKRKRTGLLRQFDTHMKQLTAKYSYDGIYVENVVNEFLPQKLLDLNYQQLARQDESDPPCFWWKNIWLPLRRDSICTTTRLAIPNQSFSI